MDYSESSVLKGNFEYDEEEETDKDYDEPVIKWINIIFLPYHAYWRCMMLLVAFLKTIFGPQRSISQKGIQCDPSVWSHNFIIDFLFQFYSDYGDFIYLVDTFIYLVHRQVSDVAKKREFLPKSGLFIFFDILSLIPVFNMFADNLCMEVKLWPHILNFIELLVAYRVWDFFNLSRSHNYIQLFIGYLILFCILLNGLTCFFILLTIHGLCQECHGARYDVDWRNWVEKEILAHNHSTFVQYYYGQCYIMYQLLHKLLAVLKPLTNKEVAFSMLLMTLGFLIKTFILSAKFFGEEILRHKGVSMFHQRVKRVVEETYSKNPSKLDGKRVIKFYSLLWRKTGGFSFMPEGFNDLPIYMCKEVKLDLAWPLFHHSPTLRKTTLCYKRWLCQFVEISFKQPDERFFTGPHCYSHIYYVKSGILQLLSLDDSASSVLSVTGGTIFGDINFYIPPRKRRLIARCLTYCEILLIPRAKILMSLHKFPEDRRTIMKAVKDTLTHAHQLHTIKVNAKMKDRTDEEEFQWIKKRWWEISEALNKYKKKGIKSKRKCEIPPEEKRYHCSKYIGQLVLCSTMNLLRMSVFLKADFPWVLAQYSSFSYIWQRIVTITIFFVLILYPPLILKQMASKDDLFEILLFFTDAVFVADVIISLCTSQDRGDQTEVTFIGVISQRCTRFHFILDVLSTPATDVVFRYFFTTQIHKFNRFIKVYALFYYKNKPDWSPKWNLVHHICYKILLMAFISIYIPAYFVYIAIKYEWAAQNFNEEFYFGHLCIHGTKRNYCTSAPTKTTDLREIGVFIEWIQFVIIHYHHSTSIADSIIGNLFSALYVITNMFLSLKFVSVMYVQYQDKTAFQYFVSGLKKYYIHLKIHPDLLKRLDKYLLCHWKYHQGMDVLRPNLLKKEPYDIYHKMHGAFAEKKIGESKEFLGVNSELIRELASKAKFLIVPKNSTLIVFGVPIENVTWVVKGVVEAEYIDEYGDIAKQVISNDKMLSTLPVFLDKSSLHTYSSLSDVEILYINKRDFNMAIRRYSIEFADIEICKAEIMPLYDKMLLSCTDLHRDYQKKLRSRIFHEKQSHESLLKSKISMERIRAHLKIPSYFKSFRKDPEALITQHWLIFRAITILLSYNACIFHATLNQGSLRDALGYVDDYLAFIKPIDLLIRPFIPYYDERGLVVTHKRKCVLHYLTRSFTVDVLGFVLRTRYVINSMSFSGPRRLFYQKSMLFLSECFHFYIITGFFDYHSDKPSASVMLLPILKWQIILWLMISFLVYALIDYCVTLSMNDNNTLVRYFNKSTCWIPFYFAMEKEDLYERRRPLTSDEELHLFVEAIRFTVYAFVVRIKRHFNYDMQELGSTIHHFISASSFWFAYNFSLSLLILYLNKGHSAFNHEINKLKSFLKWERVPKDMIERTVDYFLYWWKRTKGIDMKVLMNDRIGVVFRQDLNYYFFKRTFKAVNSLLKGGETLERLLASASEELFCLPGEEIMREMDLTASVFIVHRGKINITKNERKLVTLTKGSIFGQLVGSNLRPSHISACAATDHSDLLMIPFKKFHEIINDDVRKAIKSNPNSKNDYMSIKKTVPENPYNSIKYILRGDKNLRIPRLMIKPINPYDNKWYARWLMLVWVLNPAVCSGLAMYEIAMPEVRLGITTHILLALDTLHIIQLGIDFFSGSSQLYIVKIICLLLIMHVLSCGWIYFVCKNPGGSTSPLLKNTVPGPKFEHSEIMHRTERRKGCPMLGMPFRNDTIYKGSIYAIYTPIYWQYDYLIGIHSIIQVFTRTNLDFTMPLTALESFYETFITITFYLVEMVVVSNIISFVYTSCSDMYHYDYKLIELMKFLRRSGTSVFLNESVATYYDLLWMKRKGQWLPEITHKAPFCLRTDIMSSLYMHHFLNTPVFSNLPNYFLRQLSTRLQRVVIFPGKFIVQEGDILPCIYFIHEGEVERWYTDKKGEFRFSGLLTINGHFGLVPGIFPNTPHQFTFISRTVIDVVRLEYQDWQDLLDGYPDLKVTIYSEAMKMRRQFMTSSKMTVGKSSSKSSLAMGQASKTSFTSEMSIKI